MELVYKHEKSLFRIAVLLSALFWIVLTVATFGVVLIYLLLGYLFFLFAHAAFISHLKGSGVRISEEQYPDLYEKMVQGCNKVGLKDVPEAYLLRTDYFNALATKFLGRYFVVLFTDVVDALEDKPGAIDFYIGHELGHIHRKHLTWNAFIMPASILPVLGTALRRAEEYTCDRYGVACCGEQDEIQAAIAAIAAGDTRWKSINLNAYLSQIDYTRGFWMSFNELTGDYPWLTKRMATSIALSKGEEIKHPRRHMFAWILSIFIPRFGAGGAVSLFMTIAIIGILAAVAIPAYQQYVNRANFEAVYTSSQLVSSKVDSYVATNNKWPTSMMELGYESGSLDSEVNNYQISIYDNGIVGAKVGVTKEGEEKYIILEPEVADGKLNWTCYAENVDSSLLPQDCR